jgi:hypothetical protein
MPFDEPFGERLQRSSQLAVELKREGRRSQQPGSNDNREHTELFHDRSPCRRRIETTRRVRIAFPSNPHDRNTADIKECPGV